MSADPIAAILGPAVVPALGRAILHSFWQVALAAAATWLALGGLRRAGSNVRYLVACGGLLLALALPVATFAALDLNGTNAAGHVAAAGGTQESAEGAATPPGTTVLPAPRSPGRGFDLAFPWLAALWSLGVVLLWLRLLGAWWATARLSTRDTSALREQWRQVCDRVLERAGVTRGIRILESAAVGVPTVIGWLRPVVLLPVAGLSGLTPWQVEAILAHELAHVRRHDYLVNLLQSAVETLLFYHPAAWWLSARIRREREHCCDDLAVAMMGDALGYARALTALETRRTRVPRLAAAANGGPLMRRIARLRDTAGRSHPQPGWVLPVFVVLFVALALASATAVRAACNDTTRIGASAAHVGGSDTPALHAEKRRMTLLEAIVFRLPVWLRQDMRSLGLETPGSGITVLPRRAPASLWDHLFPEVLVVSLQHQSQASEDEAPADADIDVQAPAAPQDRRTDMERTQAELRRQMEQMARELSETVRRATADQFRAAQEAMQQAADDLKQNAQDDRSDQSRAIREAMRQAAEQMRRARREAERALREQMAHDRTMRHADMERALKEAQETLRRQMEEVDRTLARPDVREAIERAQETMRREMDRMDRTFAREDVRRALERARETIRREMERLRRQLREQGRHMSFDQAFPDEWFEQLPPLPPEPPAPPAPAIAPPAPPKPPRPPAAPMLPAPAAPPAPSLSLPAPPAPPPPPPAPPAPPRPPKAPAAPFAPALPAPAAAVLPMA